MKPADKDFAKQREPGWKCPECGLARGGDRADPCIGKLPGVIFACCGHGGKTPYRGYVYFENGVTIRFEKLIAVERSEPERVAESLELKAKLGQ